MPYLQRDLPTELSGLLDWSNAATGAHYDNAKQFNGAYTDLNLDNFGKALTGSAGMLGDAWKTANPELASYTGRLGSMLDGLNAGVPTGYNATGYDAATAAPTMLAPQQRARFAPANASTAEWFSAGPAAQGRFDPAQAYTAAMERANASLAAQQRARGGPLLSPLEQDARANLGRVSGLQQQQQGIAGSLLAQGGRLGAQDLSDIEQDTRAGFAARGLYDSNQAIGAEILNKDAARRARLKENLGIAQGVDAAGQQQLGAGRNFALGVQGQGQGLSQFNAGQGNQVNLANASLLTDTSRFNAGQGNATNQFNAGLQTQNSQFNAGRLADMSLANAGMRNSMAQFDAGSRSQNSQFNSSLLTDTSRYNSGLGAQTSQFNAGQGNAMNQFGASLLQQNNQYNAGATNDAQRYNVGAVNDANRFNTQLGVQNANDQWARAMQLGGFNLAQAQDPTRIAAMLQGQMPDYTGSLLGYGSDLNNTNFNAINAANISAGNNSAAKSGAMIQGGASVALAAKMFFMCVPEGQRIDTPHGGVCIENLRAGTRVIGYDGFPVYVVQKHEYMEDPNQHRFVCLEFEGTGHTLTVCDKHRIEGRRAGDLQTGDVVGGRTIKSKTWHGGVRRSYDILTSDAGYRIHGVPVNSMIEELAEFSAQLKGA